jgi:hypothetical protein
VFQRDVLSASKRGLTLRAEMQAGPLFSSLAALTESLVLVGGKKVDERDP